VIDPLAQLRDGRGSTNGIGGIEVQTVLCPAPGLRDAPVRPEAGRRSVMAAPADAERKTVSRNTPPLRTVSRETAVERVMGIEPAQSAWNGGFLERCSRWPLPSRTDIVSPDCLSAVPMAVQSREMPPDSVPDLVAPYDDRRCLSRVLGAETCCPRLAGVSRAARNSAA
jgi:hypothetical protein